MTTPDLPLNWIREISPELKSLDSIPLTGASPSFPWEELASRLADALDVDHLSIQPGEVSWRSKDELCQGLGDNPFPLVFTIPTMKGQACWIMPEQELSVLAALLLTKESHPLTFHDRDLSESFYRFLALEVLYQLTQISFDTSITPILTSTSSIPDEDSLCKDISISLQGQTIWGRLIISPDLRGSWVDHFAQLQTTSELSEKIAQDAQVTVHLEAGKSELSFDEWNDVKPGDFILLDSCSFDPEKWAGRVILTVNGKRVFRGKLKEGSLKILELPLLNEA
jgi:flagellar motor switch protein FliN/FliY